MLTESSDRFKRGLLVHRLLQSLPELPEMRRRKAAEAYLARPVHGLNAEAQTGLVNEVINVLDTPAFAPLFAPDSHAETPIIGTVDGPEGPETISGQVDRLVIRDNEVIILDYKTNRPAPQHESDVPEIYYRQMAAYRAVLRKIYPDRRIRCALLWTDGPHTIYLSERQLDRHFGAS